MNGKPLYEYEWVRVQGPVRVTKDLFPAASKAAVYTDSTTPAPGLTKLDKGLRAGDNLVTSSANAVGRGPRRIDAVKRIFSEGLCLGGLPRRVYLIGY